MVLIRNFNIGFISPQIYFVYDSKSQMLTGGYEENDDVVSHMWDTLIHEETDNILSQDQYEQETLSYHHHDWLTTEES